MSIQDLGFDPWFEAHTAEFGMVDCTFARVCAVDRGVYRIRAETQEIPAELSGRLAFQTYNPAALPCVGDWVTAQQHNNGAAAIIHQVFPRRSFLRRKSPGENATHQMIAANIDVAFIVQSCHFDFNPSRLERYLAMAADGHVEPVVILTKTDVISPEELQRKLELVGSVTKAQVLALSNVTGSGFEAFQEALSPGRTYCLLGSSGVGKTTLVNRLLGRQRFETRAVSGTGEGTHTTTRRQLIVLEQGAMLIDTPGMRELGLMAASQGIEAEFDEFAELAANCRYTDCSHRHEPGCAIRAALETGELRQERYASYLKLKKESEFHELSSLDKRKKDKAFGRLVKEVKKRMKK